MSETTKSGIKHDNVEGPIFKYSEEHKKLYLALENENDLITCIKIISLLLFFSVVVGIEVLLCLNIDLSASDILDEKRSHLLNELSYWSFFYLLLGLVLNTAVSYIIREDVFESIERTRNKEKFNIDVRKKEVNIAQTKTKNKMLKTLLVFISPDYTFSNLFKKKLIDGVILNNTSESFSENDYFFIYKEYAVSHDLLSTIKIERKFMIERVNWFNLIISILLSLICISFLYISNSMELILVVFGLFVGRLISRIIEVVNAFYTDVAKVNSKVFYPPSILLEGNSLEEMGRNGVYEPNFKSSLIRSEGRISLAIHTLIEFIIMFTVIYLYADVISKINDGIADAGIIATPLQSFLYSFSLGFFNISYIKYDFELVGIMHILQVFVSIVLIYLSLAQYLGKNILVTEQEKKLYSYVKSHRNYQKK